MGGNGLNFSIVYYYKKWKVVNKTQQGLEGLMQQFYQY